MWKVNMRSLTVCHVPMMSTDTSSIVTEIKV